MSKDDHSQLVEFGKEINLKVQTLECKPEFKINRKQICWGRSKNQNGKLSWSFEQITWTENLHQTSCFETSRIK